LKKCPELNTALEKLFAEVKYTCGFSFSSDLSMFSKFCP